MTIRVGLYGGNGHQIAGQLVNHPKARCVAVAGIAPDRLPQALRDDKSIRRYDSLDALLADEEVDLVSLCSPRRLDQARDAVRSLDAGKHVYAEKPCAMTEIELDGIIATASRSGRRFHEMAHTAFDQPYLTMRRIVQAGEIGRVIQVFAQKSYPFADWRPQDEATDGGIINQAAVHALRMIEHVTGVRIADVRAFETRLGNPRADGGLRIAAALALSLENGGVGAVTANYLNPQGFGRWGNETLRVFGDRGMIEAVDGGTRTRLVVGDKDHGPIDTSAPAPDYFSILVESLLGGPAMPLSIEDELHPTRMTIRAKNTATLVR